MLLAFTYVVHLAFVVPMLVLEVPFSKWAHMLYRPFAIYLHELHRDARWSAVTAPASPAVVTAHPGKVDARG